MEGIRRQVDRSFLEMLDLKLLLRLVEPFADELCRLGMPPEPKTRPRAWLERLHRAVNEGGILASALQTPLGQIQALANERGYRLIAREAAARGIEPQADGTMPVADLALWLYLSHRDVFRAVLGQIGMQVSRTFEEYHGRGPPIAGLREIRPELQARLVSRFRDLWLASCCETWAHEQAGDGVLEVRRAGITRSLPVIGAEGRSGAMHVVPEEWDLLVYSSPIRRLSISTRWPEVREVYRSELGVLLGGRQDYFQLWESFSAEPLRQKGTGALDASDVAEIKHVVLQHVEYYTPKGRLVSIAGDDVGSDLDELRQAGTLETAYVSSWTMGFVVPPHRDLLKVRISPPNGIVVEEPMPPMPMRQFLRARKFLVAPPNV